MAVKKRQHFVPQFYLRGFRDLTYSRERQAFLWVYAKGHSTPRRSSIKTIGFKKHFYSVRTSNGDRDLIADYLLTQFEGRIAPIWVGLGERDQGLSDEERSIVAYFIALMYVRVPSTRKMLDSIFTDISRKLLMTTAQSYNNLTDKQRDFIGLSQKELREIAKNKDFRVELSQNAQIRGMFSAIPDIADVIQKMNWAFFHSPQGSVFITSDNPVVLVNPYFPPGKDKAGFGIAEVEVTFPVNSNLCMFLTWNGPAGHIAVSEKQIDTINRRTASHADEAIYSSTRLEWLESVTEQFSIRRAPKVKLQVGSNLRRQLASRRAKRQRR